MKLEDIAALHRPFVFLRHGETESNLDNTIAGSRDVLLTPRGHEQARAAAAALRGLGITAIYVSALRRTVETAGYVAQALALPMTVIAELGERNWGELEGKPRTARVAGVTPPGADTPEAFRERILRGLARIRPVGLPLIVSHSGVFRMLCSILRLSEPRGQLANAQPVRFLPGESARGGRLEQLPITGLDGTAGQ